MKISGEGQQEGEKGAEEIQGGMEAYKEQAVRTSSGSNASSRRGDNEGGRKMATKEPRRSKSYSLILRSGLCLHGDCLLLQHLLHHGAGLGLLLPGQVLYYHFAMGYVWPHLEHS